MDDVADSQHPATGNDDAVVQRSLMEAFGSTGRLLAGGTGCALIVAPHARNSDKHRQIGFDAVWRDDDRDRAAFAVESLDARRNRENAFGGTLAVDRKTGAGDLGQRLLEILKRDGSPTPPELSQF